MKMKENDMRERLTPKELQTERDLARLKIDESLARRFGRGNPSVASHVRTGQRALRDGDPVRAATSATKARIDWTTSRSRQVR
jgi:hypothetical protein